MKKFFSALTALLLAAMLLLPAVSLAETGGVFMMNDVSGVSAGDTVDITLSISGDYEVHGMNLSIEYDPTAMVLESCVQGEFLQQVSAGGNVVILDCQSMANRGMIKLGVVCPINPVSGEGELFTMHFRIKEGVTVNQQVIMVVYEFIKLPLESLVSEDVPFTTDNSIITLNGGSDPDNGYNEGGSGIGNNTSDAPEYPTRDPQDPDANVTPAVDVTPTPVDETLKPADNTPAPVATEQPDDPAARETKEPEATKSPAEATTADPEQQGSESANTPEPDGSGTRSKTSPVVYGAIGAAVLLAGAAAALVIRNKKKQ